MGIDLTELTGMISNYKVEIDNIKYVLNESETEEIQSAAIKYLTLSSIPKPDNNSKKINLYDNLIIEIRNQADADATNVTISIIERIAKDAEYNESEGKEPTYDTDTLENIFYKLIEEIDSTITQNIDEIYNLAKGVLKNLDSELEPNITDLNEGKYLLPPDLKTSHYADIGDDDTHFKIRPFIIAYNKAHRKYNLDKVIFDFPNNEEEQEKTET